MNKKEVGARIKAYMKQNKITQVEIAQLMGVGQSYVSGMLNGDKNTLNLAEAIANHYNVSLDWIVYGTVNKKEELSITNSNITEESIHYSERIIQLFQKYIENERRYQEIIKENQEIMKQLSAIHKLIKEEL